MDEVVGERGTHPALARGYMKACNDQDRAVVERVRARARTDVGSRTVSALWRSFATPGHDLRAQADHISAPTLIVWGGKDIAIPEFLAVTLPFLAEIC